MTSKNFTSFAGTVLLGIFILFLVSNSSGKPWAQTNPFQEPTLLESGKMSCPEETKSLCQRCAKQTESPLVYPWCCTNYEATREWCTEYLAFGLPLKSS